MFDRVSDYLNIIQDSFVPFMRYYLPYILIVLSISICLIVVSIVSIFLFFIIPYICYYRTFKRIDEKDFDALNLPDQAIYNAHKEQIIEDIKEVRKYRYEELNIKSVDGLILYAKYFECKKGAPIELMFHGYKGSAERDLSTGIKRAFLCGRNVVLVDQRASGKSDGKTITFGIMERLDALEWAKFVSDKFGKETKILLTGVSMGAATVLMASALDLPSNVVGILSDCSYNSPKDIIMKVVKDMKLPPKIVYPFIKMGARIYGKFNLEETSPLEAVQKTKLPVIFYHGTCDDYVPCHMSEKLYEACQSQKKLVRIEGGMHGTSYLKDPKKYVEELNKFFIN